MIADAIEVVDTFPEFEKIWPKLHDAEISLRPEIWLKDYMSHYPELLQKQLNSYKEDGDDWRQVAMEHVFPYLEQRYPGMAEAHSNILQGLEMSISKCRKRGINPAKAHKLIG